MGWLCTSTGPLSHLFLFPAICCFLPDFFLFLYLGCTTANIICVFYPGTTLVFLKKSYNLNEWGNFFCSNHSIFFPENSCICNTMHACSVFLDGHITYCHFSFMKNYKGFEHKETIIILWLLLLADELWSCCLRLSKYRRTKDNFVTWTISKNVCEHFLKITWTFFKNREQF